MANHENLASNARRSFTLAAVVLAFFAATASAQLTATFTHDGVTDSANMGQSVSGLGDINGDFRSDYLAGAPFTSTVNGFASGSVRVYSGIDGSTIFTFNGDSANDNFGSSVNLAGDVNNDGVPDIIVGAPGDDNGGSASGSARVFSGATGAVLYTRNGLLAGDSFGQSVSGAGDVNADGFDDFIVGAPFANVGGTDTGSATVFSGVDGSVLYTFSGTVVSGFFGSSVSGAGDANDDGNFDVIVGAPFAGNGTAEVFSGADGATLHTLVGDNAADQFGASVSNAADIDEDDFGDFIVGAAAGDYARLYSGIDGSTIFTFNGALSSINFGGSVSDAGDVNADGVPDVVVGASGDDTNGTDAGAAHVYSGTTGALLHSVFGDSANDGLGQSVSGAGDTNLDAFGDIIVGMPGDDNTGTNRGAARIYTAPFIPVLVYTSALADSRLRLRWVPDLGDPNSLTGTITCSNATLGAFGRFGLSLAPANSVLFGFPLLLAIDPFNLLDMGNFGFGLTGAVAVPAVSRQNAFLAGSFVFIQFFESSPFPASSNGLAMLVTL